MEISFHGYDDDARELFEIEEVRRYVAILDRVIPELFFFVRTDEPTHMLRIFVLCQSKITQLGGRSDRQTTLTVSFKTSHLGEFLARHFAALNEMTDWLSMSEDENKKISLDVFRCLDAEASESAADP